GGQRLHLDAGLAACLDFSVERQAGQGGVRLDVDGDTGQKEGMAKRNQLMRTLRRHDPGDARRAKHIAFLHVALEDEVERGGAHYDSILCNRDALRLVLHRHIDHMRVAGNADMSQFRQWRAFFSAASSPVSSARVAAETSSWRISDSPTRKVSM